MEEALRHQGRSCPADPAVLTGRERHAWNAALLDWLETGGFPEAQGLDAASRHQLLRDYVDVAMLRDVVERHNVRNVASLRRLVRHLLGNAGGMFSIWRALAGAGKLFPRARERLLTLTHDGFPAESPTGTGVQTAWEWLLRGATAL